MTAELSRIREGSKQSFWFPAVSISQSVRVTLQPPVQQQEWIALLGRSQWMVAANKLLLLSDPCLCVCGVVVCTVCACVRDPEWLVPNKEMKSIVGFFFSPPSSESFLLLLHLHFSEPLGELPRCNQLPDKHRQHLSCGQKCWVAITSQQTT